MAYQGTPAPTDIGRLLDVYRDAEDDQFALFLGSGVNGGAWAADHPACASWPRLLGALDRRFHSESRLSRLVVGSGVDWIDVASRLLKDQKREAVIRAIDQAIYAGVFRDPAIRARMPKKHKVLTWTVLQGMDTLRATVCFSAAINDAAKTRSMRRNPKIGRVLTTNYDFFFGAAWPRFTSMKRSWWPSTWASAGTRPEGAGPIVYLHGYLPYSGEGEKDVILTRQDYDRTYSGSGEGGRGFAWRALTDAIDHCHMLFIGFSFSDQRVAEALRRSRSSMRRFAFLLRSEPLTLDAAASAGVEPVALGDWGQLPGALGDLYRGGVSPKELERVGMTSVRYWTRLQQSLEPRT